VPPLASLDAAELALPPDVLARTQTPALVIDLERVRRNVGTMLARTGGADRWRPHVKTTKTPEVWAELVHAGVTRFKCATTREARVLVETLEREQAHDPDVCVGYPLRGPALDALARLARDHPGVRLSVLCEDADLVRSIPDELGILVDVNLGMDRTGVPAAEHGEVLAVARGAGERLRGLHGYEGLVHDGPPETRRAAAFACYDRLLKLVEHVRSEGLALEELVTSGTPGFPAALAYPPFAELAARHGVAHRVSPGTVVLHDARSEEQNGDLGLVPAAWVVSRVVSRPAAGVVTCDAGSKALAAEAGDPCAVVAGHPELVALPPSEEHLPLRVTTGGGPARGEALALVPRHVCPTVNLAEEALLRDGDELRVVPVRARAHDLAERAGS
jgi:D-serine deaminase-like pyridoxal phosphate-dependent protein